MISSKTLSRRSAGFNTIILFTDSLREIQSHFFDRDGVINERIVGGYIRSWDEFHFMPDVAETLKAVKDRGYITIIIRINAVSALAS